LAASLLIVACETPTRQAAFDPKTCLETVPKRVKGLQILEGPRSENSIIQDMVFPICNARALFRQLQSKGDGINPGRAVFLVTVEYTGEVIAVGVQESTIESEAFLRKVSDFIMDTDFVPWTRNDIDAVFLYPVAFK
jgi:hypothetical protein